ncbi:hypothetical protein V490_01580 [Pseudogymnoascus sp. VKM F-3557]|nr:hypothetical protein V490_01580 [Pseudogymnoascus sp. VKM F-3557]
MQSICRKARLQRREDSDTRQVLTPTMTRAASSEAIEASPNLREGHGNPWEAHQDDWPLDQAHPLKLYSDGLTQVATELNQKYELDHISSISAGGIWFTTVNVGDGNLLLGLQYGGRNFTSPVSSRTTVRTFCRATTATSSGRSGTALCGRHGAVVAPQAAGRLHRASGVYWLWD